MKQIDAKTWESGFLRFVDTGTIPRGATNVYEVINPSVPVILGWVKWSAPWRRYVYRAVTGYQTDLDSSCLTAIAEFCTMQTDERKSQWGPQGRLPNRN
jgi:hypothetical protein